MNLRKSVICGIVLCAGSFSSASWAGSYTGLAKPYWFNGALYINIGDTAVADSPACRTRSLVKLQETDYNDPVFKNKYAMLLAAWFAQRPVYLGGTGQCTSEGDEIIFFVSP